MLNCQYGELDVAADAQFLENTIAVAVDSLRTKSQVSGNLAHLLAIGQHLRNL